MSYGYEYPYRFDHLLIVVNSPLDLTTVESSLFPHDTPFTYQNRGRKANLSHNCNALSVVGLTKVLCARSTTSVEDIE